MTSPLEPLMVVLTSGGSWNPGDIVPQRAVGHGSACKADGRALSKADYRELYVALCTQPRRRWIDRILKRPNTGRRVCIYGETETHFNIPDLRGRIPVGDASARLPSRDVS